VDPFDHVKPVWFYVVNQFDLLAPWALLLPAALVAAFGAVAARARENGRWSFRMFDDEERRRRVFPLFVFLSIFLFFTISRSRRTYYLMPAAPFACLVIATFLDGPARGAALFLKRAGLALLGGMGVVAGAVVLVAGSLALLTPAPPTWLPGAERIPPEAWAAVPFWLPLLGVAILPGVLLLRRLRTDRGLIRPAVALAAIVAFAMAGLRAELRGATDSLPGFCEQVREFVPPGVLISREEGGDAKLVHYLDRPTVSEKVSVEKYRVVTARRAEGILSREPGAWTVPLRERRWRPPGSPDKGSGYVLLVAR
jgi:4-amino-4-deoxy-L-arabinose transferase-like glycosyltransferase